jgi:hypothetical protein
MRIEDVATRHVVRSPTVKARVFDYIHRHPDEVFCYRDEELAREIGAKPSAVGFALWTLHEGGHLEKEDIDGKTYFGFAPALRALRKRLHPDVPEEDYWAKLDAFADDVFKRYGYIDLKDLLEETREGR